MKTIAVVCLPSDLVTAHQRWKRFIGNIHNVFTEYFLQPGILTMPGYFKFIYVDEPLKLYGLRIDSAWIYDAITIEREFMASLLVRFYDKEPEVIWIHD